jgi:mitochondrial fission protein ELM1
LAEYRDFVEARGGTRDTRDDGADPYSAASYAAQYGIPIEDARELISKSGTHGQVKAQIYQHYLKGDQDFRDAAINAVTRPFAKEWSQAEQHAHNIANTTERTAQKLTEKLGRTTVKDFSGDMGL